MPPVLEKLDAEDSEQRFAVLDFTTADYEKFDV